MEYASFAWCRVYHSAKGIRDTEDTWWAWTRAQKSAKAELPPILGRGWEGVDGIATPLVAGKGAIDTFWLHPIPWSGWMGVDRAGDNIKAELGDGVAAPVVAGKGAINPLWLPSIPQSGWVGLAASSMVWLRNHDAVYLRVPWT